MQYPSPNRSMGNTVSRRIDTIIVHCAATPPSMDIGVREIRKWHQGRGWRDIGYHYVIRRDGTLESGRDLDEPGAHAKGYNADSVGVCLVGGVDEMGKPDANFTFAQYKTLHSLLARMKKHQTLLSIMGHRDISDKACPCFDIHQFAGDLFG